MRRALALADDAAVRRRLIPDLVDASSRRGDGDEVGRLLDELRAGDEQDQALETVLGRSGAIRRARSSRCSRDSTRRRASSRRAGDLMGLGRCERARAWVYWAACRHERRPLGMAQRTGAPAAGAGSTILARDVVFGLCLARGSAGSDVAALLRLLDELEDEAAPRRPVISQRVLRSFRARWWYAMAARSTPVRSRAALEDETALLEQMARGSDMAGGTSRGSACHGSTATRRDEAGTAVAGRADGSRRPCTTRTRSANWAVGLCTAR